MTTTAANVISARIRWWASPSVWAVRASMPWM